MNLAAIIRSQVEAQLQNRIPSALSYRAHSQAEALPIGIKEIDGPLGGVPRGALTEITGPNSSGRTTLLLALMAAASEQQECCALIDGSSSFDPLSAQAAGVQLQQLLWVRCGAGAPMKRLERALQSTDMLLHAGGFGIVIFDVADFPASATERVPLTSWYRLRRAVEETSTILIVAAQQSCAGSSASLRVNFLAKAGPSLNAFENLHQPSHAMLLQELQTQFTIHAERYGRKPPQSASMCFSSAHSV